MREATSACGDLRQQALALLLDPHEALAHPLFQRRAIKDGYAAAGVADQAGVLRLSGRQV